MNDPDTQLFADCFAIMAKRAPRRSSATRVAKKELEDLPTTILKYAKNEDNHLALRAITQLLGHGNHKLTTRLTRAGL